MATTEGACELRVVEGKEEGEGEIGGRGVVLAGSEEGGEVTAGVREREEPPTTEEKTADDGTLETNGELTVGVITNVGELKTSKDCELSVGKTSKDGALSEGKTSKDGELRVGKTELSVGKTSKDGELSVGKTSKDGKLRVGKTELSVGKTSKDGELSVAVTEAKATLVGREEGGREEGGREEGGRASKDDRAVGRTATEDWDTSLLAKGGCEVTMEKTVLWRPVDDDITIWTDGSKLRVGVDIAVSMETEVAHVRVQSIESV